MPSLRLQTQLEAFVLAEYAAGRSLRQIAELIDRSPTAVRRVLDKHGVPRRAVGAPRQGAQRP
ncbi:helix-turn-helix domain-containing protein [Klenkia terrae]|uniref:helix-turn-helix domain-containing protein n=1 Tax=Klenkia terrae TaxID=1052259 RepID=UPI00361146CE